MVENPSEQQLREALIVFIERCSVLPNITNSPAIQNARVAARQFGPLLGYKLDPADQQAAWDKAVEALGSALTFDTTAPSGYEKRADRGAVNTWPALTAA